jgi:hypothetical protein
MHCAHANPSLLPKPATPAVFGALLEVFEHQDETGKRLKSSSLLHVVMRWLVIT